MSVLHQSFHTVLKVHLFIHIFSPDSRLCFWHVWSVECYITSRPPALNLCWFAAAHQWSSQSCVSPPLSSHLPCASSSFSPSPSCSTAHVTLLSPLHHCLIISSVLSPHLGPHKSSSANKKLKKGVRFLPFSPASTHAAGSNQMTHWESGSQWKWRKMPCQYGGGGHFLSFFNTATHTAGSDHFPGDGRPSGTWLVAAAGRCGAVRGGGELLGSATSWGEVHFSSLYLLIVLLARECWYGPRKK